MCDRAWKGIGQQEEAKETREKRKKIKSRAQWMKGGSKCIQQIHTCADTLHMRLVRSLPRRPVPRRTLQINSRMP